MYTAQQFKRNGALEYSLVRRRYSIDKPCTVEFSVIHSRGKNRRIRELNTIQDTLRLLDFDRIERVLKQIDDTFDRSLSQFMVGMMKDINFHFLAVRYGLASTDLGRYDRQVSL